MKVDSVGIFAILSMSYITTHRVPVENQITALSVVNIAIKFSPCTNKNIVMNYTNENGRHASTIDIFCRKDIRIGTSVHKIQSHIDICLCQWMKYKNIILLR